MLFIGVRGLNLQINAMTQTKLYFFRSGPSFTAPPIDRLVGRQQRERDCFERELVQHRRKLLPLQERLHQALRRHHHGRCQ